MFLKWHQWSWRTGDLQAALGKSTKDDRSTASAWGDGGHGCALGERERTSRVNNGVRRHIVDPMVTVAVPVPPRLVAVTV